MTQSELRDHVDGMVRRIASRFQPEKIILYGSHARGDAGADSDVDLLIVMRVAGSCRQMANEIDLALSDRALPLDLVVVTPEQFSRQSELVGTLVREAAREGKIIYERAA